MKTLKDHVILYDAVCPMCNLYTKGFIKTGMLDQKGRVPYQNLSAEMACKVDPQRFVNEIALVEKGTGKVYYGVESLLKIISHSFPIVATLFRCKPFLKIADVFYKFISFNRRIIIPVKKYPSCNVSGEPAFHKGYRIAYLVFTVICTSFILSRYGHRLGAILPPGAVYREVIICTGQLVWQAVVIRLIQKEKRWDYLGNLMTISFAGALALLAGLAAGWLVDLHQPFFYAAFFCAVVTGMLLEHIRRTKLLALDWRLTGSWVLYRVLVLLILLSPFYV